MEHITAYQVRNLLNARLVELQVNRIIPGPMVYTYAKNGMIDGIKRETMTGVLINKEKALQWIEKYTHNNYPNECANNEINKDQISLDEIDV